MACLGPHFRLQKSPRKSLLWVPFFVLSQEMRHINCFSGGPNWGFWVGAKRFTVRVKIITGSLATLENLFPKITVTVLKYGWIHFISKNVTLLRPQSPLHFHWFPISILKVIWTDFPKITVTVTVLKWFWIRKVMLSNMTVCWKRWCTFFLRAGTTPISEKTLRECRVRCKYFMWVRGNSGNRSESCSENCGFRIDQVVSGHSENGISYSENGISNSESCSENTPELSESSENGPFTPRAFFLKLGWSPGFW